MYIHFNKTIAFQGQRLLVRVDSFFYFASSARQINAGKKWYQDVIQLLQKQRKKSLRLQMVSSSSLLEVLQNPSNPILTSIYVN